VKRESSIVNIFI